MFPRFLKQFTRNNLIIHLPIMEYLLSAYYFPSTILGMEIQYSERQGMNPDLVEI